MAYCDEYIELISATLDGALSPDEQARLEEHLNACPECKALYDDLNRIHQTLRELPPVEVPAGLTDRIMEAVAADKVIPLPVKRAPRYWKRWAATAAVLAVILAGVGGAGFLREQSPAIPASNARIAPESNEWIDPHAIATAEGALGDTKDATPPTEATPTIQATSLPEESVQPSVRAAKQTPNASEDQAALPSGQSDDAVTDVQNTETITIGDINTLAEGVTDPEVTVGITGSLFVLPVPEGVDVEIPTETAPEEPGEALEGEMTEAELAAMEQVRRHLNFSDDYTWDSTTANDWIDEAWAFRLAYAGLLLDEQYYCFVLYETPLLIEDPGAGTRFVNFYAVPVEGGEVLEGNEENFDLFFDELFP